MAQLILISHGDFCCGLKRSVEMILGAQPDISAIDLHEGEAPEEFEKRLLKVIKPDVHFTIFTDILGGTPYNVAYRLLLSHKYNFELYTGMNLPMLISYLNGQLVKENANLVHDAKAGIKQISANLVEDDNDESF
ncbi:MAG: PTS fructose transporter subunit IIA [Bombilactobacillus mellifer]|nr:PTS fructose transporter subunit IIA [Bombilactobacillus mellifer]